jgi:hypothetical protein
MTLGSGMADMIRGDPSDTAWRRTVGHGVATGPPG